MSFAINEGSQEVCELTQSIMLYGRHGNIRYATLHDIEVRDGHPEVCAGVPMTKDTLRAIGRSIVENKPRFGRGLLPPNVLASGEDYLIWFEPASTKTMYFDCRSGIGSRAGQAPQPGLVFVATANNKLMVFAVKCKHRPVATTPLYHAPYMNVWDSGQVCVGSTPLPNESLAENVAEWTAAFFASNFSHTNHEKTVRYGGGCHQFWADVLDRKFHAFPNSVLVKSRIRNLGDLVDLVLSEL